MVLFLDQCDVGADEGDGGGIGRQLLIEDGDAVKKGQKVAVWDPHSVPVLSEVAGTVVFAEFEEDVSAPADRTKEYNKAQDKKFARQESKVKY